MVKAVVETARGRLVILGLSHENLERLGNGQPIVFALEDIDLGAGSVAILAGQTEEEIIGLLAQAYPGQVV